MKLILVLLFLLILMLDVAGDGKIGKARKIASQSLVHSLQIVSSDFESPESYGHPGLTKDSAQPIFSLISCQNINPFLRPDLKILTFLRSSGSGGLPW